MKSLDEAQVNVQGMMKQKGVYFLWMNSLELWGEGFARVVVAARGLQPVPASKLEVPTTRAYGDLLLILHGGWRTEN